MRFETLKKRPEFLRARNGTVKHSKSFVMQIMKPQQAQNNPRFGFTVTKKVGNAVQRNRVRRRLKAAVAAYLDSSFPKNLDFVLIGKRAALTTPFEQLTLDIKKAIEPPKTG